MNDTEGAFRLTFVEGQGLLSLTARDVPSFGRVERLELEIPNLRFPFDLSGGVTRFKNLRLRLRDMSVSFAAEDLVAFLREARLADYGLFSPQIELDEGMVRIAARAVLGDRQAEFTTTGALTMVRPGCARLSMFDIRVYGFLPVPPPLLVSAFFTALGASARDNENSTALLYLEGATDLSLDAMDLALLALLPMQGWRMPERRHLEGASIRAEAEPPRLTLAFFAGQNASEQESSVSPYLVRLADHASSMSRLAHAESALLRGDVKSALEGYRQSGSLEVGDQAGTSRLLNLLASSSVTLAEAEGIALHALERWPGWPTALLAQAVAASESGRAAQAAELFEVLAETANRERAGSDQAFAWFAAARQWALAEQTERAHKALDESLSFRPQVGPAVRALSMRLAGEGRWDDILPMLGRRAGQAGAPVPSDMPHVMDIVELALASGEPDLCARAVDALDNLLLVEKWPEGPVPRAEAARRMAALCSMLGDEEAAIEWLNECLQGQAPGPCAEAAWQRLWEIYAPRGDARATAQVLAGWADDRRTSEAPVERAQSFCEAARLLHEAMPGEVEVYSYLESALRHDPACAPALDGLKAMASQSGDWTRLAEILRRRLSEVRPEDAKLLLQSLGEVLCEHLQDDKDAVATYRVLLDLNQEDGETHLILARILWRSGEVEESVREYEELLKHSGLASPIMAEAHLRRAEAVRRAGDRDKAESILSFALALEPDGAPLSVLRPILQAFSQETRLAECLVVREQAMEEGPGRIEVIQSLAEVLEGMRKPEEAEAAWRRVVEQAPEHLPGLVRLVRLCREPSHADELPERLERLWNALQTQNTSGLEGVDAEAIGLELAAFLAQKEDRRADAEVILRHLADAGSRSAANALGTLLTKTGAMEEADSLLLRQVQQEAEPAAAAALVIERARLHLAGAEGEGSALALLQSVGRAALPEDALIVRAELSEKAGDVNDAIACWQRVRDLHRDDPEGLLAADRRLAAVAIHPTLPLDQARALLEELLTAHPLDVGMGEALFGVYGRLADRAERNQAWAALLTRVPALPASYHSLWHLAQAEAAEQTGNTALAEQELERARSLDNSAPACAGQLTLQARLLAGRGQIEEAQRMLDEVLELVPGHVGALAAKADLAYRHQEWEKARATYAVLAATPDASSAMPLDRLALRRAELAEMFSEPAEAEAAYQELARIDAHHAGAREALASFALARNDRVTAVFWLEEVLRLLPRDAVTRLTETRHRVGEINLSLGNLTVARENLEMALASEPDRTSTLDLLVDTYQKLGLHNQAVSTCEILARKLEEPRKKAETLYRAGEILRIELNDLEAANDIYLCASDIDPSFDPTLARLVAYYWERRDLANLAEVGAGLLHSSAPHSLQPELPLLVALAAILLRKDANLISRALAEVQFEPDLIAHRLAELAQILSTPAPATPTGSSESGVRKMPSERGLFERLDIVFAGLRESTPLQFDEDLGAAALRSLLGDPADIGMALLCSYLQERAGHLAMARTARDLALLLAPSWEPEGRISNLGNQNAARSAAWAPSAAEHPLCRGPLRKVLRALAPALAEVPQASGAPAEGEALGPKAEMILQELRSLLEAPAVRAVVRGQGSDVTFAASQPLTVVMGQRCESLEDPELRFFVARVLEQARAGTMAVARLSVSDLRGLLRGVIRVVSMGASDEAPGERDSESDLAASWASRLSQPQIARLLPSGKTRADLLVDAGEALSRPPDLEGYVRGCRFTADRVGLLASGSPLVALRALTGFYKQDSGAATSASEQQERVRSSAAAREIIGFMLSDDYTSLVED
jgi:tetratricopeptide (TPR) repeat protein